MTKLAFSALLLASVMRADFQPPHWQFRRVIKLGSTAPVVRVKIDKIMYRGSRARLADLRVVRGGVETPYVIDTLRGTVEERELLPAVINHSAVKGTGVGVTLDLGNSATHNRLRITTPKRNFKQRVRIETSDDGAHWAVSRDDGYVFDFSQGDRHVSELTVDYPASNRRYLRATIFGWSDPKSLTAALLTYSVVRSDTRDTFAAFDKVTAMQDGASQSTIYSLDLGFDGLAHDEIQMDVGPGLFYRAVEIDTSTNGKDWSSAGQGVVYRTAERQQLSVCFSELWDRHLRLRIMNRDDQPLDIRRISINTIARYLEFPAQRSSEYWLYYGNPAAKQPAYDLGLVLPGDKSAPIPEASPGVEQVNPEYRPKPPEVKPWSDRHPALLYAVLGAAILAMGYVTVRFLGKVSGYGK